MRHTETDDREDTTSIDRRRQLRRWCRLLVGVSLVILLVSATSAPVTAVSATQTGAETGNVSVGEGGGEPGDGELLVDQLWCWVFDCPEPVSVTQSEPIIIGETPSPQQGDSSQTNQSIATGPPESNTSVIQAESGSGGETVSEAPQEGATDTIETQATSGNEQQSTASPEVVRVVSPAQSSAVPWWWLLLITVFVSITTALIALALYRRVSTSTTSDETVSYPATLNSRVTQASAQYSGDGGATPSVEEPQRSRSESVRLPDARTALNSGSPDQSISHAVQALSDADEQAKTARDYDELFRSWESTAAEIPTAPATLEQLRDCHEQATFGPRTVTEEDAMACIETVEALLTADNS